MKLSSILALLLVMLLAGIGTVSAYGPISFDYNGDLVVTYQSQDASYNNEFGLFTPGPVFLGKSHDVTPPQVYTGKGRCTAGEDVILSIKNPLKQTYRSDIPVNEWKLFPSPPYLRFVPVDHAQVTPESDGSFTVGFEDEYGGYHADYNDVVLNVACVKDTPVPEFPTLALPLGLIIGILGTVFYIRETRKQ